jgi:hypothetical protein
MEADEIHMSNVKYIESQRMLPLWVGIVLAAAMAALVATMILAHLGIFAPPGASSEMPLWLLVPMTVLLAAIALIGLFLRLETTVTDSELRIKTILSRRIMLEDIEGCEAVPKGDIHPVSRYGGWGVRYWTTGIAYLCPGNEGAVMVHEKGREKGILICSKRPDDLLKALP